MTGFPGPGEISLAMAAVLLIATLLGGRAAMLMTGDRTEAWLLAPATGFALYAAISLPVCAWLGVSFSVVGGLAGALCLAAGAALPRRDRGSGAADGSTTRLTLAFAIAAALLAILAALPVAPQLAAGGAAVGPQIFDHVKIALIDEIARTGTLPPGNPFYGGPDPKPLLYYYLLYLVGAQLRVGLGVSGWGADIALTWFAAFASLLMMGALARRLCGRTGAMWWVLPLSLAGSLQTSARAFGVSLLDGVLSKRHALEAWPDQASWAPHHMMAGTLAVLAVIATCRLLASPRFSPGTCGVAACLAAASFGCSAWVGGITLAVIMSFTLPAYAWRLRERLRLPVAIGNLALAGGMTIALAWPLIVGQWGLLGGSLPVRLDIFPVLAPFRDKIVSALLDVPAFWLVLLPLHLTAIFIPAVLALPGARRASPPEGSDLIVIVVAATLASLLVAQFVSSALSTNDLGWRAIVPAILLLTAGSAAALHAALRNLAPLRPRLLVGLTGLLAILSLPGGLASTLQPGTALYRSRLPTQAQIDFRTAPRLWREVRRLTGANERVLNNPMSFATITPWQANLGWALFSDRRSCAAGDYWLWDFAPMERNEARAHMRLLDRFFAGQARAEDITYIFGPLGCRVVIVTRRDAAWANGGMERVTGLTLIGERRDAWRIYRWTPQPH